MTYALKVEGEYTTIEASETGRHAVVKLLEPRPLPTSRCSAASVFVQVAPDCDVAVSVNSEWWFRRDSDRDQASGSALSGRTGRNAPAAEVRAALQLVAAALRADRFGGSDDEALSIA